MADIGSPVTLYEALQGNKITDNGLLDELTESLRRQDISSELIRAAIRRIKYLESTNQYLRSQLPQSRIDKHRKGRKWRN